MIGRPNPDRLRQFLSMPATPLDDRGRPIQPKEREVLGSLETRVLGSRRQLVRYLAFLPMAAYLVYLAYRFWKLGAHGLTNSPLLGMVAFVVVVSMVGAAARKAGYSTANAAVSATSAALGLCGACGYDVNTLQPAEDGCVQCPECGAAWHIHRRTHIGLDQAMLAKLVKLVPAPQQSNTAIGLADDRGVRLLTGYQWPRPMLAPKLPESAAPAVALFRADRRTLRLWCFAVAGTVWLVVAVFAAATCAVFSDAVYITLVSGVVLLCLAPLISFVSMPARKVRSLALRAERCPHCYQPLSASLVCFDGCTVCPGCRASWRAEEIGGGP